MKALAIMLASAVMAFGYGYWDSFDPGARIPSLSAVSGGMCGATVPDPSSALSVFVNPSALAAFSNVIVSASGWQVGWRASATPPKTRGAPSVSTKRNSA